jgi:uncharacterized glyoxalase superfamily protein PhnB
MSRGVEFTGIFPILPAEDLEATLEYYRERLGFAVEWRWGDPPVRAGVGRDGVELQLDADRGTRPDHAARVYLHVRGVDAYYESCVESGAQITLPLEDRAFGMRDFRVEDPAGNVLGFGEPVPGRAEPGEPASGDAPDR